jgi:hypothetical protein
MNPRQVFAPEVVPDALRDQPGASPFAPGPARAAAP